MKINMQLLATFTVTFLTLTTTPVFAVSSVDPLGCTITWHIEDQTVTLGGTRILGITSEDDCQEYCISKPHCVAVEFDYSSRSDTFGCWYHENTKDLEELFTGENVKHFQIQSSCPERKDGASPAQVTDNSLWSIQGSGNRLHSFESGVVVTVFTTICVILVNCFNL